MVEICIRENYIDTTALQRFSREELTKPPYNFTFVEIDEKYADCEYEDFDFVNGEFVFNKDKYSLRKDIYLLLKEKYEIETWFDEYDNQVKQYQRCVRLGIDYDKDINELDNQAKLKQERIREIRGILDGKI